MKVMTFNIQHGRNFLTGKIDLSAMANEIKKCGGQIVCMNEVYGKGPGQAFVGQPHVIAEELGYRGYFAKAIWLHRSGPYGNGFVSAFPVRKARTVRVPTVPRNHPGYFEDRCAFCAQISTDEGMLTFIGCHFGLQVEEQIECVKTVCSLIDASPYPVVLAGDFNVEPDDKVLLPIRERLKDTADLPGGNALTFPSDKPIKKIDYIFVSNGIRVESVTVPGDIVSDHLPIVAEIHLN